MPTNNPSYAEMYAQHPVYSAFDQERRQSGNMPVEFLRVEQPPFEAVDPAIDRFALGIVSSPSGGTEVDFGEGLHRIMGARGVMYLNPTETDTLYRQQTSAEYLFVSAPLTSIADGLGIDVSALKHAIRPLYETAVIDAGLANWVFRFWDRSSNLSRYDALAVDHGLLVLAAELLSIARRSRGSQPSSKRLDDGLLAQIGDYTAAELENGVSLADLAALTGLSRWAFSRDFKATTGQTPHEFVTELRLARARELLSRGQTPLAEIAYACGFSSQAHMTTVFRHKLGVTPGRYRQDLCS